MLHLYYGRETINKDRFLFFKVQKSLEAIEQEESGFRRILLVVPDQFTLQAEQNAFHYLKAEGLMDVDILSQSRLAFRILSEVGGITRTHIDKYGRHMLLTKIIKEQKQKLQAYSGLTESSAFVEMANDLIIEMKQHNVEAEEILNILESVDQGSLLYRKLRDIYYIFQEYERKIAGRYLDTEDQMRLVTEKISESQMIRKSEIWIYGFDSFTPKTLLLLGELMKFAAEVHVVMLGDGGAREGQGALRDEELFELPRRIMGQLRAIAEEKNVLWEQEEISEEFLRGKRHGALARVERDLYAYPQERYVEEGEGKAAEEAISFCRASNFYTEAETAAAEILAFVRDQGYRYSEIAVICNDLDGRGSVIERVFHEYEIPVFVDKKRSILHNPAVEYVLALLDIMGGNYRQEDVLRLAKTGLTCLTKDETDRLENYAIAYRITGNRWKNPLVYGVKQYGEEEMEALEVVRERLIRPLLKFEAAFSAEESALGKTRVLYEYLANTAGLPRGLTEICKRLEEAGELELLSEASQIWEVLIQLLDQIVELIEEEPLSVKDYRLMLNSGFVAMEIGMLPPTFDQVIVGTMQRTRTGRIRALFVLGANDGVLPASGAGEELLHDGEKQLLLSRNIILCKDDLFRTQEERLAIYKNLSKPEEKLWMSYSVSDAEGGAAKPSMIYEKLAGMFPKVEEEKDILNRESEVNLIQGASSTLAHLTEAMRRRADGGEELSDLWKSAFQWYWKSDQGEETHYLLPLERGLFFNNRLEFLEREFVDKIYKKEGYEQLIISPSRLERFSRCPFNQFVQYGLKPEERRIFEIAGRETGDVYHDCLMRLSQWLTVSGVEVTAPESPWMKVTEEDCRSKISELMDEVACGYREGLLKSGDLERYRAGRMKEICAQTAWILISHVRQGHIKEIFFEAGFGHGSQNAFPPIEIKVGTKGTDSLLIEGKIDRVDVLQGRDAKEYVKIIDYKSGNENFQTEEARSGWRLQLMLYLRGALNGVQSRAQGKVEVQPAGVFYFMIGEPSIKADGYQKEELKEKVDAEIRRSFKMNGILQQEEEIIEAMDKEFTSASSIIPVSRKQDGSISKSSGASVLSHEDFMEFQATVNDTIDNLCKELAEGNIEIKPKRGKNITACTYCQYKSVCFFDTTLEGCKFS